MAPRSRSRLRAAVGDLAERVQDSARSRLDSALTSRETRAAQGVAARLDAVATMVNSMTGLGTSRDKGAAGGPNVDRRTSLMDARQLEVLFRFDGYARRYVQQMVDGMTSKGWSLVDDGTPIDALDDEERRLKVYPRIREALETAAYRGGALVLVLTEDAGPGLVEPLVPEAVDEIRSLVVLDPDEFSPFSWVGDPESERYRDVETWMLTPTVPTGTEQLQGLRVHWTRCLYLPGRRVPLRVRQERNGIDDSVFEAVLPELLNLRAVDSAAGIMANELKQDVLKLEGLADLEAGAYWTTIETRLRTMMNSRSLVNAVLLGDGETFETRTTTATGYQELREGAKSAWSAVTGMPQTVAFGDAPSGLRGGRDEAGERQWAAICGAKQESHLRAPLEWLYTLIVAQSSVSGAAPESWRIEFAPLVEQSEKERAETRLLVAQTDAVGVDQGWLDANEVRHGRFGEAGWQMELPPVKGDAEPVAPMPMPFAPGLPPAEPDDDEPREDAKRYKVPSAVRGNARKAIEWKDEHGSAVKGGTATGWRRARQLATEETVSAQDIIEIAAWWARHREHAAEVSAEYKDDPWRDAGYVAGLLWGGRSGDGWASGAVEGARKELGK